MFPKKIEWNDLNIEFILCTQQYGHIYFFLYRKIQTNGSQNGAEVTRRHQYGGWRQLMQNYTLQITDGPSKAFSFKWL